MSKNVFLYLFLLTLACNAFGQGVKVSGVVRDETGEALPGVNVVEKGTLNGTSTNLDGQYELRILHDNPILVFSFIGYSAKEVVGNGKTQIDIVLSIDSKNLEEVTVTTQAKGQKNAIREQINSNTIKNVVAEDRLQENQDANSVEAIGRLPGIAVSRSGGEGNGLIIRGLESKYSAVTLMVCKWLQMAAQAVKQIFQVFH